MNQYKLCTIHEFAEYVAEIINAQRKYDNNEGRFTAPLPDYDFAIADDDRQGKSLEEIALNSSGWYGMKKFDAGFDSVDLCLITDYYGGGCAKITQIWNGEPKEYIITDIENMIINSFKVCEWADSDDVLIIEFEEENGNEN